MKRTILFFALCALSGDTLHAQAFDYNGRWSHIDTLAKLGNVKSLLPAVDSILQQAKQDSNSVELVSALTFKISVLARTQDEPASKFYKLAIDELEKEMPQYGGATKAILQSQLAHLYRQYAGSMRRTRQNQTELESPDADIATWTTNQLLTKSINLFRQSVSDKKMLQGEKTQRWQAILNTSEDIGLYPTLFDVLQNRFVKALQNYRYSQVEADSLAQVLLGELIDFHKNDSNKSAFLNCKLTQITYSNSTGYTERADSIFALAEQFKNEQFAAYLYYQAADLLKQTDPQQAYTICVKAQGLFPCNNKWIANCKNLIIKIQEPRIEITYDEMSLPNAPIAVQIRHTNCDSVFYKVYKNIEILRSSGIETQKGDFVASGCWALHKFSDFAAHTTCVKLDGLPQGSYSITIANNRYFHYEREGENWVLRSSMFVVTEWVMIKIDDNHFQLINRKTGRPIANQELRIYRENNSTDAFEKQAPQTTNVHGMFALNVPSSSRSKFIYYNSDGKNYETIDVQNYSRKAPNRESKFTAFFTDRAIYRPGQTVYFKAILYSRVENSAKIAENEDVKITLCNANREQIAELPLTSNEYGSVSGQFVLPSNGLTGPYCLQSDFGQDEQYFQVEEYKRPKFEVLIDSLKGEYVLEKEVAMTGKACSFAGAPISDAKVVWRIERHEVSLHNSYPVSDIQTIANGEVQTNDSGRFVVKFMATASNKRVAAQYRTCVYYLYADITDINGETHSVSSNIIIGDLPRALKLKTPKKATQSEFTKIIVTSTNRNNVSRFANGKITITRLISPKRIVLPNKYEIKLYEYNSNDYSKKLFDYQIYSYDEFVRYFPHLPYSAEERNPQYWKRGKTVEYEFNTEITSEVDIKKLEKGFYVVEAFSLYGNDTVRAQNMVEIQDDKTLHSTDDLFFDAWTDKSVYRVGETITINLLSDINNATAILHIESDGQWIEHKEITIKNGRATCRIKATDRHVAKGLFGNAFLLWENGYKQQTLDIEVENRPKDLTICTKVFRDKLTPGAPETWELVVGGQDKDKFTAEVLATMYDASLDKLASHSYTFMPFSYYPDGWLYRQISCYSVYRSRHFVLFPAYRRFAYRRINVVDIKDVMMFLLESRSENIRLEGKVAGVGAYNENYMDIADLQYNNSITQYSPKPFVTDESSSSSKLNTGIIPRTNLRETAFFYPKLYTDSSGNVRISFTSPEALTTWKLLVLAHTQDLRSGTAEFFAQTQKELMVVPNLPRFLREGDTIRISTKINNLSAKKMPGEAQLELFDAVSMRPINADFGNENARKAFDIAANRSGEIGWTICVPKNAQAVQYKIVADAGEFSDGEQGVLPVLTNRTMVTETMPIFAKEGQTKTFTFSKLTNSDSAGGTLQNFSLSLEATANPLWIAVMSLPYLREFPYECSEQLFSRLYGNVLSAYILNKNTKLKQVFEEWNTQSINVSSLEKNMELKNMMLSETPWLRQAQRETEQRKRLALMFDTNNINAEFQGVVQKIAQRQNADGGFAWFNGGASSQHISEHIVLGFGQLRKMLGDDWEKYVGHSADELIAKTIEYCDNVVNEHVTEMQKNNVKIDGRQFIHYYYVRSFWKDKYQLSNTLNQYLVDINKDVTQYFGCDLQRKAMMAVMLHRYGYQKSAKILVNNMKETSIEADEVGMYWQSNRAGWLWFQSPVEAQAKAIEAFAEVAPEHLTDVEEMKIWLMKNRQTNAWNSTKATTNAIYALTSFGKDWTNSEEGVKINVGNTDITDLQSDNVERAAGYIKTSWRGGDITPDKGRVTVVKSSPGTLWGGVYWQYFEDLDKITSAETNVKMQKQLFLKTNTPQGKKLVKINEDRPIKVGDLVAVRLVIKIDREMQYIHIKDMRAAGFEPVNVLSGYKFQNGAAYYESTRDAATDFFFERMSPGTYVFEYDLRANNSGLFSNGITTLQNMYAPEMSAHSEGVRVEIVQ